MLVKTCDFAFYLSFVFNTCIAVRDLLVIFYILGLGHLLHPFNLLLAPSVCFSFLQPKKWREFSLLFVTEVTPRPGK